MPFGFNPLTGQFDLTGGGGTSNGQIYASSSAFPAASSVSAGTLAVAADSGIIYESNASIWQAVAAPGDVLSLSGSFGSTPNAVGASLTSNVLQLQPADGTHPGLISTTTQTFGGVKTFSSNPIMSGLTASQAVVTDASKNLASLAYTASNTASTLVFRDANGNASANNFITTSTSTVSSVSPITLTAGSTRTQIITGTIAQTVKLPNATTLIIGASFVINNNSTQTITVNDSTNTLIASVYAGAYRVFVVDDISSPAGIWESHAWLPSNSWWGTNTLVIGALSTNGLLRADTTNISSSEISGDATTLGSNVLTLATVNANTGTFGSSTAIPSVTVNGKGLITAMSTNAVVAPAGTLTGTTLASNVTLSSLTTLGTISTGIWQGSKITSPYGGTGQDSSSSSGVAQVSGGNWSFSTALANGTTATTQAANDNSTKVATTAYVDKFRSSGDIGETSFTAADNQAVAANVTGLTFANATVRSFEALVSIVRSTTYSQWKLFGVQKAAAWEFNQSLIGDDTGITFSITTAGQVQYTSTSTGSTATVKFRAITTSV